MSRGARAKLTGDFVDADLSTVLKVALSLSPLDVARGDPEPAEGSKGEAGTGGEGQGVADYTGTPARPAGTGYNAASFSTQ